MSVIWKYLNKRSGAIDAIGITTAWNLSSKIPAKTSSRHMLAMTSLHPSGFDGLPHSSNPHAAEDHIISGLADIDILKERYRQAVEYMAWFQPAWDKLSSDEQYVLETFYADEDAQTSAVYAIADHFHIERSSAYKRKNRALDKFAILLFGKT
jgi:hypothetical protein